MVKYLTFANGDKMPALGLGTWKAQPGEVAHAVKEAIKIGYKHIDCAAIYQNESEIGQALAECFSSGLVKREDLWITSKLWNNSHKQEDVESALRKTLDDLRLDYLDLYLIHWPIAFQPGISSPKKPSEYLSLEEVPLEETWKAMEKTVDKGLCRHIGVSNFSIKKLNTIKNTARVHPEVNQIELHPFLAQPKMISYCQENDIKLTAYAPLGSKGREETESEPDLLTNSTIKKIASLRNCTPAQVLLNWAVHRGTSTIPKSTNTERLRQNLESMNVQLTEEDISIINNLDEHYRFFHGKFWVMPKAPYTLANLWDE